MYLDPAEFHRLKESRAAVHTSSDSSTGDFDPVVSLHRTGVLLAALKRIIATAQPRDAGEGWTGHRKNGWPSPVPPLHGGFGQAAVFARPLP